MELIVFVIFEKDLLSILSNGQIPKSSQQALTFFCPSDTLSNRLAQSPCPNIPSDASNPGIPRKHLSPITTTPYLAPECDPLVEPARVKIDEVFLQLYQ
jgi:hypothetical protein